MNDSKEEIENLRKQINRLKISLMFTQISTIMVTIILGCQCLRSIQNYRVLLFLPITELFDNSLDQSEK